MKYLPVLLLSLLFLPSGDAGAQVSQGFESQFTSQTSDASSFRYVSAISPASPHELVTDMAAGRQIPVSATTAGTELGFRSFFRPTHSGGTGLTDGDFFGYAGQAVVLGQLSLGAMQEGSQAFMMEDTDGEVSLLFDPVTLPATATGLFSMYFAVEGTLEINSDGTNDRYYIALDVTECPQAQTMTTTNSGATVVEGQWNLLSESLTPYGGCAVQLKIEVDVESASEEFAIDNIVFATGMVLPVELENFSATAGEKDVDLSWITASEDGNRGFSVERSMDGTNFSSVGWVDRRSLCLLRRQNCPDRRLVGNN